MDIDRVYKDIIDQNKYIAGYIIDEHGRIVYINDTYLDYIKMDKQSVLGRPVTEISPETRTLHVLKTGKPEYSYNWKVGSHNMIASSIPIFQDNKVIGVFAYSLFFDILEARERIEDLISELNRFKNEVRVIYRAKYSFSDLIGNSQEFKQIMSLAKQIAKHPDTTILITGESGTGKDLLANAIHNRSIRSVAPFVRINCTAIPDNLFEAELFGYDGGAYTDAKKSGKAGKLEIAHGGTVFLDEIGEMPYSMQSKLLIFLQEQEIERIGATHPIQLDVRIIAATNQNLEQLVRKGSFRQDLFYRLNVFHLEMTPLSSHKEDIPLLAEHFIERLNKRLQTDITGISNNALKFLEQYHWPGNVRELQHAIERAMIIANMEECSFLNRRHFGFINPVFDPVNIYKTKDLKTITENVEKNLIQSALREAGNNILTASQILGIDRATLYRKLKKYDFEIEKPNMLMPRN